MESPRKSVPIETLLRHRAWVRRLALSMARDQATADDLEQETWVAALDKPPHNEGAIRSWLHRVMRNRFLMRRRREARLEKRERIAAKPDGTEPTDTVVARAEAQRSLVNRVFDLAEPYRTTMILRYFEELTPNEVAERLGVPANTVRVREKRALAKLRGRFDQEYGGRGAWCLLLGVTLPTWAAGTAGTAAAATASTTRWGATVMALSSKQVLGVSVALFALLLCGLVFFAAQDDTVDETRRHSRVAGTDGTANSSGTGGDSDANGRTGADLPGTLRLGLGTAGISGEVRFAASDTPASDATVSLRLPEGKTVRVTTGANGSFAFAELPAGFGFRLQASAPNCATTRTSGLALAEHEQLHAGTLWLDTALTARVLVVDPRGQPVGGAKVDVLLARQRVSGQDWAGHIPTPVSSSSTDPSGLALFDDLGPGHWTFRATHANFAPAGVAALPLLRGGVERTIRLTLQTGHSLQGRVLDAGGEPVRDAKVLALKPREATASMAPLPLDPLRIETTSDHEGHYRFDMLPQGGHAIAIVPAGGLPCRIAVVEVPAVSEFDIRLDGGVLFGRVVDAESGSPLAGAHVRGAFWRRHHPTYMTAVTDADGRYRIPVAYGAYLNPPARGQGDARSRPVNFEVRKDGYVMVPGTDHMQWSSAFVVHGAEIEWNLKMRRGATLQGAVQGPDGAVAGARVRIELWNSFRGLLTREAVTDGAGRYEIPGILDGKALIRVEKPGYFQEPAAGGDWLSGAPPADSAVAVDVPRTGTARLDATLQRGALLEGRVETTGGQPVTAASVTARWKGASPVTTTTDANGAFRLASVRPGAVALVVERDGFVGAEREERVQAEGPPITIRLEDAGRIEGVVSGPGGDVPAGAYVQVADARTVLKGSYEVASIWQKVARQPVAEDGRFAVELPWFGGRGSDGYIVRAVAPGCAPFATESIRVAPGETRSGVRLRLEVGHTLRGVVVHSDGSGPVAGARIEFSNDRLPPALGQRRDWSTSGFNSHPFEIMATTGADGKFAIENLPAFTYRLRVSAPQHGWAQPTVRVPADGDMRIEMFAAKQLRGRVVFEDATPAAWVQVRAHRPGQGFIGAQGTTDAEGRFQFGVGEGEFTLETRADWRYPVDIVPTVSKERYSPGEEIVLRVRRGKGVISGRCVAYGGEAVPGAWILFRTPGGAVTTARSNPNGEFTLAGLTADAYHIRGVGNRSLGGPERYGKAIVAGAGPIRTGTDGVVLEFQAALEITGRVLGPEGEPTRNSKLVVRARAATPLWDYDGKIAPDGTFRIGNLPAGAFTISLLDPRSGKSLPLAAAAPVEAGTSGVDVRMRSTGAIEGVVVDSAGKPVPNAQVFALGAGRRLLANTQSGVNGKYRLAGLDAGIESVEARHAVLGRSVAKDVTVGASALKLQLAPQPKLAVRLLDSAGQPIPQSEVLLVESQGRARAMLLTDAEGRIQTAALPTGTYRIEVHSIRRKKLTQPFAAGEARSGSAEVAVRYTP